jgi:hypothetical protein
MKMSTHRAKDKKRILRAVRIQDEAAGKTAKWARQWSSIEVIRWWRQHNIRIDASVAVNGISQRNIERAPKVRRDYVEGKIDLASLALVIPEVFNPLRYHPGLSPSDMTRYVDSVLDMQMDLRLPSEEANRIAAKLAVKEGMRARLLTSDAKLRDKLSNETKKSVKLPGEYY